MSDATEPQPEPNLDPRLFGVGLTPAEQTLLGCLPIVAHEPTYGRLFGLGVRGWAMTGGSPYAALHVEAVCRLDAARFEFGFNMRDASGASISVIIPAQDEFGATNDLASWNLDTGEVLTWRGSAPMLGEESLEAPRIAGEAVCVFAEPLEWLRADREGVVILDGSRARWRLAEMALIVTSASFGARLNTMLRLPQPQIFVDASA